MEPAEFEGLGGFFRIVEITAHHMAGAMDDLAHRTDRNKSAVIIHEACLDVEHRFASRSRLEQLIFRLQNGRHRPHFRLAVVVPEFESAESDR